EAEAATAVVKVHARAGTARAEVPFELVVTRTHTPAVRSQAPRPDKSQAAARERQLQNEKRAAHLESAAKAPRPLGGRGWGEGGRKKPRKGHPLTPDPSPPRDEGRLPEQSLNRPSAGGRGP